MKGLVRWAIANTPAMNTLMAAILIVGSASLYFTHREVFPEFELEIILVTVPYPGAAPEEVEEGICQKIEEAVQAVDGINKIYSIAREGSAFVILELESDVPDVQKILNEVRSEIDRIPSLPELTEDPKVEQITLRREAIQVGVIGPEDDSPEAEVALRQLAERVRRELLLLPSVSQAELVGTKAYQIDIEIPEETLRKYGLTLQQVARIVRQQNIELPGGTMKLDLHEVLLRGKDKRHIGRLIAEIPVVTDPSGVVLTVGDLGQVRDQFEDVTALHRINGQPGLVIRVDKTSKEDLMAITREVRRFVQQANKPGGIQLPPGYRLTYWGDLSVVVQDRLNLLARNGLQGLILVFIALATFLEIRLAFWVALGIPVSLLGASAFMLYTGQTLNMLSMFGFLMALGIVVDDAIVVGENIYAHRERGKGLIAAAVDGTVEVLPSVLASVATTIIAFCPLLFVPGVMGKFIAVMPVVVIAMLVISLVEATFILPCHLAHSGRHDVGDGAAMASSPVQRAQRFARRFPWPVRWTLGMAWVGAAAAGWFFAYPLVRISYYLNRQSSRVLRRFIDGAYVPFVRWSLRNPSIVLAGAVGFLLVATGLVMGGIVPFNVFPKLDSNWIVATIEYPDGTAARVTDQATRILEEAIWELNRDYQRRGGPIVRLTHRMLGQRASITMAGDPVPSPGGSHMGQVLVELVPTEDRPVKSDRIVAQWRRRALEGLADARTGQRRQLAPGYESLAFEGTNIGPGGAPIEFKLLAVPEQMDALEKAVQRCREKLQQCSGVFDIRDDSRPGKWEFQLTVKDSAKAMGITLAELAGAVRAAYYGEEVMRLQRGRHEVKLMVRYPRQQRRSLADFNEIQIRTPDGAGRPLTELADVKVTRGYSVINRLDQLRSVTITADVDESLGNAQNIIHNLQTHFLPGLLAQYPGIRIRWEGQQEQWIESTTGLFRGLTVALICMFALLTLEFRTYLQPLLILTAIPFGAVGAVAGHWLLDIPVSLFSLFGMVALTGVVVNDSIVLIDFMNRRVRAGMPLLEAIVDSGRRRFRPVMLTSVTTVAALLPILVERSFQAQVVIPMAASLAFGLLFATVLVLVLVPVLYLLYCRYLAPDLAQVAQALGMPTEEVPLEAVSDRPASRLETTAE